MTSTLLQQAVEASLETAVRVLSRALDLLEANQKARARTCIHDARFILAKALDTLVKMPPALQQQEEPREVDGDGPIRDGWQISIGPGHDGFGVYAHMTDYPEEGAVCICTIDPAEYPAASPSPQDFTLPMVEEGKGADGGRAFHPCSFCTTADACGRRGCADAARGREIAAGVGGTDGR